MTHPHGITATAYAAGTGRSSEAVGARSAHSSYGASVLDSGARPMVRPVMTFAVIAPNRMRPQ